MVKDVGKVSVTRGNPLCMEKTGAAQCLYCVTLGTAKETYVSDSPDHMIEISGKKKTFTILMRESSILPAESETELRFTFINSCKQFGCSAEDIAKWRLKAARFSSVGEALK